MGVLALAAAAQTARIVLRWTPVPDASGYELQIAKDPGFVEVVLQTRSTTPGYRWEALPNATHWYRVRSFDKEGRASEWSPPRTIAIESAVPLALSPADRASSVCGNQVTFELEASKLVKQYGVQLSSRKDFGGAQELLSETTSVSAGALAADVWYWRPFGVDLRGRRSEYGPVRSLAVRIPGPKLKATADVVLGQGAAAVSWSSAACAKGYLVEITSGPKQHELVRAPQLSVSWTPKVLGAVRLRVAGLDGSGAPGDWSAEGALRVTLGAPVAKAEVVDGRSVTLTWALPAGASLGVVELSLAEDFSASPLVRTQDGAKARLEALAPGVWHWRVQAKDAAGGLSPPSKSRSFTIAAPAPLALAQVLSPGADTWWPEGETIELRLSEVPGALRARLEVDGVLGPPVALSALSLGLLPPGAHRLRVQLEGEDGRVSPFTEPFVFGVGSAPVARVALRQVGREVRVTLLDTRGTPITTSAPRLSVEAGGLSEPVLVGDDWVARWTPPEGGSDVLRVVDREFEERLTLDPADLTPLHLAARAGGVFNGGAVTSFAAVAGVGYRLPFFRRRLGLEARASVLRAARETTVAGEPLSAEVFLVPVSLLAVAEYPVGAFVLRGGLGPSLQVAWVRVGVERETRALPGIEASAVLSRKLGPGLLQAELSFQLAYLDTPLARLNAGGFGLRVGYAFDLPVGGSR